MSTKQSCCIWYSSCVNAAQRAHASHVFWLGIEGFSDSQPKVYGYFQSGSLADTEPFQIQLSSISERRWTPHISIVSRSSAASFAA